MRTRSCLRYGIVAFALAFGFAAESGAACQSLPHRANWFLPDYPYLETAPEDFAEGEYWKLFTKPETPFSDPPATPCEEGALPVAGEAVYITFGTTAVVASDAPTQNVGTLYVGGWDSSFEGGPGGLGQPGAGDEGTL